ncbi:MAG: hypothetical protein ACJAYR_002226 [Sneathiella sp.]
MARKPISSHKQTQLSPHQFRGEKNDNIAFFAPTSLSKNAKPKLWAIGVTCKRRRLKKPLKLPDAYRNLM